ncbi:Aquaporin-2 [Paramyrothecium foliicola]|nr:Aquaporin-2 [Paramyrothecium foliicola]
MSLHTPRFHQPTVSVDTTEHHDLPSSPTIHELAPETPRTTPKQPSSSSDDPAPQASQSESGRPRSNSQPEARVGFQAVSPQGVAHDVDNFSYRTTPRRANRSRIQEEIEDDYWMPAPWERTRDHDRYWRDDSRLRRAPSRHGPWSRPPPALLNHYPPGFAYSDDDLDDLAKPHPQEETRHLSKPSVEGLRVRKRRSPDEEMGYPYPPEHGLRRDFSSRTFTEGGRRLDWHGLTPQEKAEVMRLPWTQWMNSDMKNHFVAWLGEFIGTTMFLFFAFAGTEVANIRSNNDTDKTTTGEATGFDLSVLLYVSLSFGFSLMVNVWVFFRISGGLFNPAVTMGMLLVKAINPTRAGFLVFAQILGSLMASVIVRYLFPETFNVRTTLGGGATIVQGVFIEALLTAELVFTIFMLAKEKHRATFIAPVGIGLALFIAELVGVQFTGGSLNPARSFGPCVITGRFDQEHWIYWVGPAVGTLIAVGFYRLIKTLEYEMANPGADGDDVNDPTKNPEKRAEVQSNRAPSVTG